MFVVTNLSNNPLLLSDGKAIAAHDSRKVKEVSDRDRKFEARGWLSIIEEVKEEAKADGGKLK